MYELKGKERFKTVQIGNHTGENLFVDFVKAVEIKELSGWSIALDSTGAITIIKRIRAFSNPEKRVYVSFMNNKPTKNVPYHERVWELTGNLTNGVMRHILFEEVEQTENTSIFRCLSGKKVFYVIVN